MNEKAKRSKLPEKSVRVPSIQLERKAQVIRDYLGHVGQRPDLSEYARGVAFVQLLKDLLLDAAPQFLADYLQGMEHSLGGPKTALYSQGRVDASLITLEVVEVCFLSAFECGGYFQL